MFWNCKAVHSHQIHRKPNMIQIIRKLCDDNTNGTLNGTSERRTANGTAITITIMHLCIQMPFKRLHFYIIFAFIYSLKLWLCTPTSILILPCLIPFRGGKTEFLSSYKISNLNDFLFWTPVTHLMRFMV